MDEGDRTSTLDSGLSDMGSPPYVQHHDDWEVTKKDIQDGIVCSKEYKRFKEEIAKTAEDTMTDRKKIIAHPGWHSNKPGLHQTPINMDTPHAQPGYGMRGNTCCQKTALFCGDHCGCPSMKTLRIGSIRVVARIVMAVLVWAIVWSSTYPPCATDDEETGKNDTSDELPTALQDLQDEEECEIPGLPGSSLFGILMIFLWGMIAEALIVMIPMPFGLPQLPPLLGSLLVGILLRNVAALNVGEDINNLTSSRLRNMALGIILGRAGLEVDKKQMYKLRWVVPRLAFLPCIIEACSYGVISHWILDLPWNWSFMLGFVCGAVAPACVVPSMIKFQEEGYGTDHGVPSLLIAAASIDDIVAINVFNILLTTTFGNESIGYDIGIALAEILLGIALGLIGGYFLQKVPDRRQHNVIRDRTFLLIALSFFFIFATDGPIDLAGAGTLGTLICSFVAAIGWQLNQVEAIAHHFKGIWFYFQPLLFGLTGATVDISQMEGDTVVKALACIVICLAIRLAVAGNAVSFLGWSHKEKFMTAISWIPKATVQAAIGGAALSRVYLECGEILDLEVCPNSTDTTRRPVVPEDLGENVNSIRNCVKNEEMEECLADKKYAQIILQVSVLLILITAPIGVFLIGVSGPRLLPKSSLTGDNNTESKSAENRSDVESSDGGIWSGDFSSDEIGFAGKQNFGYTDEEADGDLGHTEF